MRCEARSDREATATTPEEVSPKNKGPAASAANVPSRFVRAPSAGYAVISAVLGELPSHGFVEGQNLTPPAPLTKEQRALFGMAGAHIVAARVLGEREEGWSYAK